MLHKIYVAVSNGAQKIDPRISTIFLKEAYIINMIKALDSF